MDRIISRTRGVLRSLIKLNIRHLTSNFEREQGVLSFVTAVSGFDNKHTHYKTNIRPRWLYGDDACFVSVTDLSCVLGVADGVGGWRSYGVDPSNFSKAFMSTCERLVASRRFHPSQPLRLIVDSYQEVLDAKIPLLGSATFCIISLCRRDGRVYTVCLGDSGYLVIRHGSVVQRSSYQKHAFNTPFQLASLPPNQHGQFHRDAPEEAVLASVSVEPGDVVLVGTDGLFDNLSEPMILKELRPLETYNPNSVSVELLEWYASRLVACARNAAEKPDFTSPFANEARRYGLNIAGGARGDITVMLAFVVGEDSVSIQQNQASVSRQAQPSGPFFRHVGNSSPTRFLSPSGLTFNN